jgi:transposase
VAKTFSPKQLKIAELLAAGLSQVKAAEQAGVSRITVIRWLKIPEFQAKVSELSRKLQESQSEAFAEATKANVRQGIMGQQEMLLLFSSIARDSDSKVGDRLKAAELLSKMLGFNEPKRYQEPPAVPSKPFGSAEMSHRLDILKSTVIVASQFLAERAIHSAGEGNIQDAAAVLSRSFDLAKQCTIDVPQAANTLVREGYVVLTPVEYSRLLRLLPEGQKSSQSAQQPLDFDRVISIRWVKRKSG